MKIERLHNAKRNILWGTIYRLTVLFPPFVVRTILIQNLGAEYLGLSGLFASLLQVFSLAELGFDSAIVFSMYRPIAEDDKDTLCALLRLYRNVYRIVGLVILGLGLLSMPFLKFLIKGDYPDDINLYILFGIYLFNTVLSYLFFAYKISVLKAHQREDVSSKVVSVCNLLTNIIQIVLLLVYKNYYFYAVIFPLFTLISNFVRAKMVDKKYPEIICKGTLTQEIKQDIKKRISGMILYKAGGVFRTSFDNIILSSFLGLAVLAKYQNYFLIVTTILGFLSIINSSIIPGIGNSISIESKEKNLSDFKKLMFVFLWISGWCAICLLCLFQPFMQLWMGQKFLLQMEMVYLFCVYFFILKLGDITFVYREAAGLWWEDRYRPIIESAVNLFLNIFLVLRFGVMGVLASTILAMALVGLPWSTYILFNRYFKCSTRYFWVTAFKSMLITIIIGIATFYACSLFAPFTLLNFFIQIIICSTVPNILYFLIYRKKAETKYFIDLIKSTLQNKKK